MTDQLSTQSPAAMPEPIRAERPRIYVACLAAYNNGTLHGCWIDATSPDEIMNEVHAMLAASPIPDAEEWAIHDYEGFNGVILSEYAAFGRVCELAGFIEEHGELGGKVLSHFGDDLVDARAAFEEYAGEHRSAADFAEQLHEDVGTEIPASFRYYIDWEALARDMELNGEIITFQLGFDEVHIFWSR